MSTSRARTNGKAWAGSTRKRHDPPGWRRLRARILERDGHRCRWVDDGARCTAQATVVDHVVNVAAGGTHAPSNLQALCQWHSDRKSAAEGVAARAARTAKRAAEPHPGART